MELQRMSALAVADAGVVAVDGDVAVVVAAGGGVVAAVLSASDVGVVDAAVAAELGLTP